MIDCHVHCRDRNQSRKEYIWHALDVAKDSGLSAIFDMPNTAPTTTTRHELEARLKLAEQAQSPIFYGIHMGITADKEQIKEAVDCWKEYFPKENSKIGVVGLKMFAGNSIGDLEIIDEEKQLFVYKTLRELGYGGVLVVHCEKEKYINHNLWNPEKPSSQDIARPEKAEIESIKDQMNFARHVHYDGQLHIAHVSTPESVDLINYEADYLHMSCGVTPHHLLLDTLIMDTMRNGFLWKVNPPLRKPETRKKLLKYFLEGRIDILESDHAPHTYDEKMNGHLSGIPNLASWPDFTALLKKEGMNDFLLERASHENPCVIYGIRIPRLNFPLKNRVKDYVFDPYKPLK